jgi:hypothetical protein
LQKDREFYFGRPNKNKEAINERVESDYKSWAGIGSNLKEFKEDHPDNR